MTVRAAFLPACPTSCRANLFTVFRVDQSKERCGLGAPRLRIKGGSPARPNQFPWMAFLHVDVAEFFAVKQTLCSATLIKPRYLLTAAHCVFHA